MEIHRAFCRVPEGRIFADSLRDEFLHALFSVTADLPIYSAPVLPHAPSDILVEACSEFALAKALSQIAGIDEVAVTPLNPNRIWSSFCLPVRCLHLRPGGFARLLELPYARDLCQMVGTDPASGFCLLKLCPRIDYEAIGRLGVASQGLASIDAFNRREAAYRPPQAMLDPAVWAASPRLFLSVSRGPFLRLSGTAAPS
jgi:hypothetical protein